MRLPRSLALLGATLTMLVAGAVAARPRLGLEGGLNQASLSYRAEDPSAVGAGPEPRFRPAWSIGPVAEWTLTPALSLSTGARYLGFAERWSSSATLAGQPVSEDVRIALHYLGVPLRLEAHPLGRAWPLMFGGEAAYLMKARRHTDLHGSVYGTKVRPMSQIYESEAQIPTDVTGDYRRLHLALSAGAGFEWRLGPVGVVTRGLYSHGLTDVVKSGAVSRTTRAFEFTTGVRF